MRAQLPPSSGAVREDAYCRVRVGSGRHGGVQMKEQSWWPWYEFRTSHTVCLNVATSGFQFLFRRKSFLFWVSPHRKERIFTFRFQKVPIFMVRAHMNIGWNDPNGSFRTQSTSQGSNLFTIGSCCMEPRSSNVTPMDPPLALGKNNSMSCCEKPNWLPGAGIGG